MPAIHQATGPSARKKSKRLRLVGLIVLTLGLVTAAAVYWIQTYHGEPTEDELLAGNVKAESRQMEILYGKMGLLTQEISDDLKQPGVQACLIAAASVLVAAGCFYVARLEDDNNEVR